ncbi:hypothetical protein VZ94_10490 [Methylocucumis oryzae]|uniref:Uncharacterized protein n=1 Tax=Methylocucumis oryzae TaxID=1632867 RepID=A0A0F3ILY8_9GAMM|nr:hypothetical protein VZ94_10490 [Methylocucumis oryzae]
MANKTGVRVEKQQEFKYMTPVSFISTRAKTMAYIKPTRLSYCVTVAIREKTKQKMLLVLARRHYRLYKYCSVLNFVY